jgi:hypothetical protein
VNVGEYVSTFVVSASSGPYMHSMTREASVTEDHVIAERVSQIGHVRFKSFDQLDSRDIRRVSFVLP